MLCATAFHSFVHWISGCTKSTSTPARLPLATPSFSSVRDCAPSQSTRAAAREVAPSSSTCYLHNCAITAQATPWDAHALRTASSLVDCVLHITSVPESTPSSGEGPIILPCLRRLCVSRTDVLDFMETPALRELYCCRPSTRLYPFLARALGLHKLFVAVNPSSPEPDIAALLRGAGTIPNIHLCLYIPASAACDLFSLLSQIPVPGLRALSICLAPEEHPSFTLDEAQLMQTVESLSQDGALRSFKLSSANITLSVATLACMERLRGLGMEMVVSPGASPDMVPEDFRFCNDRSYHLHEPPSKGLQMLTVS
ncbi:hypothetical protein C8R47DRAFT_592563 [Mycena vitilis]|nr:hypothetical protein C8R47DRAFT_592563 [Mycena vitilis]